VTSLIFSSMNYVRNFLARLKCGWNTAEINSTAFQPHTAEVNCAVEINCFNRTSTACFHFRSSGLSFIFWTVCTVF
jgi:hypothetical protein